MLGRELFDCPSCGSAKSIEHGVCQLCLTEFPMDTKVIELPRPADATRAASPAIEPTRGAHGAAGAE